MADQDNVQVARQAYAAFGRGDIASVLENCAEDIEWVTAESTVLPWAGTRRGKAAVEEYFRILGQHVEFQRFEPYEFIAQRDKVVVLIHDAGVMRTSGRTYTSEDIHVSTYRDGKVVRFQAYGDTAAFVAAYQGT